MAARASSSTGKGTARMDLRVPSFTASKDSGQRLSLCRSGTWMVVARRMAERHGPSLKGVLHLVHGPGVSIAAGRRCGFLPTNTVMEQDTAPRRRESVAASTAKPHGGIRNMGPGEDPVVEAPGYRPSVLRGHGGLPGTARHSHPRTEPGPEPPRTGTAIPAYSHGNATGPAAGTTESAGERQQHSPGRAHQHHGPGRRFSTR